MIWEQHWSTDWDEETETHFVVSQLSDGRWIWTIYDGSIEPINQSMTSFISHEEAQEAADEWFRRTYLPKFRADPALEP